MNVRLSQSMKEGCPTLPLRAGGHGVGDWVKNLEQLDDPPTPVEHLEFTLHFLRRRSAPPTSRGCQGILSDGEGVGNDSLAVTKGVGVEPAHPAFTHRATAPLLLHRLPCTRSP